MRAMAIQSPLPVPTAVPNAEAAVALHGEHGRRWLDGLLQGDPPADAVVAELHEVVGHGPGFRLLRRALAAGVDALDDHLPPALSALFASLDAEPAWLDHDMLDRAAEHLARQTREYGLVLGAASLLAGAGNSIAGKPLALTGRYVSQAAVRSLEVASWLTPVTTPGGLRREGLGFERTVRVRMIHAMVRHRLQRDPRWDAAAWGMPIPQSHMAFTLAEFGSVALRAMHRLGVRYTDAELDDVYHLWRYVGHLIGVDEALLPRTADQHHRIEALYALTSVAPDADDRAFVAALSAFQAAEIARLLPPGPARGMARPLIHGYQRAFVGDAAAEALGIPDTALKHLPRVASPVRAMAFAAHDRLIPAGKRRRTARGFRHRERELARLRRAYRVDHDLVDDVAPVA